MSQELHAVFEHGILRPLTPLDLPESTQVILTVRESNAGQERPVRSDPLLGLMADEPELLDDVLESAMKARDSHPMRADR